MKHYVKCEEFGIDSLGDATVKSITCLTQLNVGRNITSPNNELLEEDCAVFDNKYLCREMGWNLYGQLVAVTGVNDPDNYNLVEYRNDTEGNLQIVGGYCIKIMWELQLLLNFSIKVVTSDSYLKEENGTLGGIGQQLINGGADITIPLSYLLPFRVKHVVALYPLTREPMLAIFHPPPSTSVRDIYTGTLSPSLWIVLIITWLSVYGGYRILLFYNHVDILQTNECFLIIVAAISEHGWYKRSGSIPCSILTLVAFLLGYIILESFRATIISELAFERQLIRAFDDLFLHGFKILTNPIQQWGRYIAPPGRDREEFMKEISAFYISDEDSVTKSVRGSYAFLSTWDFFIPLSRTLGFSDVELCSSLTSVTVGNMATYSGFYVSKNSKIKEPMNYGLVRVLEHGLHFKHYNDLLSNSTLKCLAKDFQRSPRATTELQLRDVSTAFAVIVLGLLFSLILGIIEKLYYKAKICI